MKKYIIIVYSFLIPVFGVTYGQDYIHTIDTTNIWNIIMGGYLDCGPEGEDFQTHSLFINGDSSYNDNHYCKLFSNYYQLNSEKSTLHYVGLIREDTINQKIYFIDSVSSKESLIYDFMLNIGDKISINKYGTIDSSKANEAIVSDVDSILLFEIKRKRITLISDNWQYYWVEGIGSLNSLVSLDNVGANYYQNNLNCFYKNGQLLYKTEEVNRPCIYANYDDCNSTGVIINKQLI